MKYTHLLAALMLSATLPVMPAFAEDASSATQKAEWRKKWDAATPEERAKMKAAHEAKWNERYENATPEQKQHMDKKKAMREEMKKKWQSANPEEKEKLKAEWKAKRGEYHKASPESAPKQ